MSIPSKIAITLVILKRMSCQNLNIHEPCLVSFALDSVQFNFPSKIVQPILYPMLYKYKWKNTLYGKMKQHISR